MKRFKILIIGVFLAASCTRKDDTDVATSNRSNIANITPQNKKPPADSILHIVPSDDTFTTYTVLAGDNYIVNNSYPPFSRSFIRFKAILDSSCIYKSSVQEDQKDVNKLYGFADCNSFHHVNSARFGWDWDNGKMYIFADCYVNTVRVLKNLGAIQLDSIIDCEIKVLPDEYQFILNGNMDTVSRGCTDSVAMGYKLLPYFGGNEPAPHDVHIKIKEY
ncbi:MAG TPA: hypothetical protein VN721_10465 [Flavipsychrobacter sp.]|nr:hypothetical protein [Flavipsychrobacter sp.]